MKRLSLLLVAGGLLLTFLLYAATQNQIFGHHPKNNAVTATPAAADEHAGHDHAPGEGHAPFTTDTVLARAKARLTAAQQSRLTLLENSISRGNVAAQKASLYRQLARWWADSGRVFEPFAWYTAEAARTENSEKSLTFAAHLFLTRLKTEENADVRAWQGAQAAELFERSLKLNPANDSSQVGLGATILYSGTGAPMEGIQKIRAVAERDSTNVYAQLTLGQASLTSGQTDKAIERFKKVVAVQPNNLEAILSLADTYERTGNKAEAVRWYSQSLPLSPNEGLRKEIEQRIQLLKKS